MSGFIVGADRSQATLFPELLDDYVAEESAVRAIDVFVDELDLISLGFQTMPAETGRLGYDASMMLKLYIYGYMNRVSTRQILAGSFPRVGQGPSFMQKLRLERRGELQVLTPFTHLRRASAFAKLAARTSVLWKLKSSAVSQNHHILFLSCYL